MPERRIHHAGDLDRMVCPNPRCNHTARDHEIYLHSRCHPRAPTWSSYHAGVLTVSCAVCRRHIVSVAVAEAPP